MRDVTHLLDHYGARDEHARFDARHNQVEYLTTMRYIDRYLKPGMRVLEIGAGTGRYAHALARRGWTVDAVELVPGNIEQFKAHTRPGEPVTIRQGDALDLAAFSDAAYDMVLLLGPMYHLYEEGQKLRALSEALRVLRPGGLLMTAYCISDATVYQYCFGKGELPRVMAEGLVDPETFALSSTPREVFELCRREDIDALMAHFDTQRLHYVATDLFAQYRPDMLAEMSEEMYAWFLRYHFAVCERPDLVGATNHSLDIVRKGGAEGAIV